MQVRSIAVQHRRRACDSQASTVRIAYLCACAPGARAKRVQLAREVLAGARTWLALVPADAWERTYKRIQRAGVRYVWIQGCDGSRLVWATVDPGRDERAGFSWVGTSLDLCLRRIEEQLRLTDIVKLKRPFGTSERKPKTKNSDLLKIGIVYQGEEKRLDERVKQLCQALHGVASPDALTGQQTLDIYE